MYSIVTHIFGQFGDFRPNTFYNRDLLDRTIYICWNGDIIWTIGSIISGLLTYTLTVRSPNAHFQNLEILNFQLSSINNLFGHIFEVRSHKEMFIYRPYGPFSFRQTVRFDIYISIKLWILGETHFSRFLYK